MNQFNSIYESMTEAELQVCNYLSALGLWWQFEQAVYLLDDKDRPRVWTPDFYIPELGMHIEVMGNPSKYRYDYRKKIYAKNKVSIVFISPVIQNWQDELIESITLIHQQRWESIKKMQR